MRRIPLVPLKDDEIDLVLLAYRVEQAEEQIKFLLQRPAQHQQQQLDRKEAQAVISNTTIQWMVLALLVLSTLVQFANLFHL